MMEENLLKRCKICEVEKPATLEFFSKHERAKDGFTGSCKECLSKKSKEKYIKLKNTPKIAPKSKVCKKCDRELPCTAVYFPPDASCKTGFRHVCRECGADGHFMKDDYVPYEKWDKKDDDLISLVYKDFTNNELIKQFFPNKTAKQLHDKAYLLGVSGKTKEVMDRVSLEKSVNYSGENSWRYGKPLDDETKRKISESRIGKYVGENSYWYGRSRSDEQKEKCRQIAKEKGAWVGDKNPRHQNPLRGKDNGNWKGGITPLYFELRSETKVWQQKSMELCDYKCVITGEPFHQVHHLYSFRNIVTECFEILNLDQLTATMDYSDEDFENIKQTLESLHEKYGYGVCLQKDIHRLFHNNYDYKNNTPEQFEEFKVRLSNGEFDDFLEENGLKLKL